MKQIIGGYEITTASTEAAEQTKRGIESFIEWRIDPYDWLDRALETARKQSDYYLLFHPPRE